jgi:hypothetical protein
MAFVRIVPQQQTLVWAADCALEMDGKRCTVGPAQPSCRLQSVVTRGFALSRCRGR